MEEKGLKSRVTNKKYNYPKEKPKKIKTKIYKKRNIKKEIGMTIYIKIKKLDLK